MMRSSGVTTIAVAAVAAISVLALLGAYYVWWHPNADDFLGNADFEGNPITAPAPTAGVQSTYNGFLTITNLSRTLVEAVLPTDFKLAKNKSFWLKTKHPVLLLFGDQTDGAFFSGQNVLPTPPLYRAHYSEIILAIPYVQRTGQPGWHTYITRMYLDNETAVVGGETYGYAKKRACLDWEGTDVRVWQQPNSCPVGLVWPYNTLWRPLLTADLRYSGVWYDGPAALGSVPNLPDMVGMVTAKILGKDSNDDSVCSFFEWDLTDARIAEASTTHRFLARFRSSMGPWPALGTLANVNKGAVAVRGVRWRLAHPPPAACGFP